MNASGLVLTAAELTNLSGLRPALKSSSKVDVERARALAVEHGPRATRRHNLAIACSMAGSQAALAEKLAQATGTSVRAKRAAIARVLADERALSERCAILIERAMGWAYYRMTTEWIERRHPSRMLPGHVLERRHWRL